MNDERAAFEAWADKHWGTSAYLHKSRTCGEWAAWQARAALEEFAELIAVDALRARLTTEILTWHPADQPPPTRLLVMMGDEYGWRAGYWDGEQYRDDENAVVTLVIHWWALLVADDVVRLGRRRNHD